MTAHTERLCNRGLLKPMCTPSKTLILGFLLALICLPTLHAQRALKAPTNTNPAATDPAPAGQAPDAATNKITELVHDGKYAEAQQLTTGLLLAYPDDQRLIRAKALLEKLLARGGSADATSGDNQPTNRAAPAQPSANANAEQLSGRDRLDYDALIELVRQAQQTVDMEEQKSSLKQFMDESSAFLRKHPDQMLLWQLRAASAISLNDPMAGYEAGQKLLAAGAADSNDPSLRQWLAQLKNKGWLDKQKAEDYKKYSGILGTWSVSWSIGNKPEENGTGGKPIFVKSGTRGIEGYYMSSNGSKFGRPAFKGTILDSGEIRWEQYLPTYDHDPQFAGGSTFAINPVPGKPYYPSGWQPPISYALSDNKRTMTMVFPQQAPANQRNSIRYGSEHPVTLVFEKISDSQGQ